MIRVLRSLPVAMLAVVLLAPLAGLAGLLVQPEAWSGSVINGRVLGLLFRSLLFSATVATTSLVLGSWLALCMNGARWRETAMRALLPALLLTAPSIQSVNWCAVIMKWNQRAIEIGRPAPFQGWAAAWFVESLAFLPLATGIAWGAFATVDTRLIETASLHRAPGVVFGRVILPLVLPLLYAGGMLIFLLSFADAGTPSLFGLNVYGMEILAAYASGGGGAGALLPAIPGVIVIGIIAACFVRMRGAASSAVRNSRWVRWPFRVPAAHAIVAVAGLAGLIATPIIELVRIVGTWEQFANAVANARTEMLVSFRIAGIVALLCGAGGFAIARMLGAARRRVSVSFFVLLLLFAFPPPLIAIGLLHSVGAWFEQLLPVWACAVRFLPVGAFLVLGVLMRADSGLFDAARVFQANRWSGLVRVILPMTARGLILAVAVCFSLTLGELGATLLVAVPGEPSLAVRLYNLLHYGASREVAALALVLAAAPLLVGAFAAVQTTRSRHA